MCMGIMATRVLPGFFEWLVLMLFFPVFFVLPVIAFWKICDKAGFPGVLSLLMLVPLGNIILLFYLAFAEWPCLRSDG